MNILRRDEVLPLKTQKRFCGSWNPRCKICKHITKIQQFKPSSIKHVESIRPKNLNCTSKNIVYLFTSETCYKQYTGSTEEFQSQFNNYKCSHRNSLRNKKVKQESFHVHIVQGLQQQESDWNVSLIDHAVSADDVR